MTKGIEWRSHEKEVVQTSKFLNRKIVAGRLSSNHTRAKNSVEGNAELGKHLNT